MTEKMDFDFAEIFSGPRFPLTKACEKVDLVKRKAIK